MRNLFLIILAIFSLNFSCEETEVLEIEYINYGTSFGECLGYCKRDINITNQEAIFTKSGWGLNEELPDSSFSIYYSEGQMDLYTGKFDKEIFLNLEDVIGCPDCADGGAEYVEIAFTNQLKRVNFEYMNEPAELEDLVVELRKLMQEFE